MGYKPRTGLVSDMYLDTSNAFVQYYYLSHKTRKEKLTENKILCFKSLTHKIASLPFLSNALISVKGNTKR